jgi:membrane protein
MAVSLVDLRRIGRFIATRFREDDLAQVAGSLTFTTLFGLVPLVTIAITVLSALPISGRMLTTLDSFIVSNFVPGSATKLITAYTHQFAEKASRLTAIGIGLLAVTALMMMLTIDRAFNRIWRVDEPRSLLRRMLVYWALLTAGPILIGLGVYLTYWLVTASLGLIDERDSRTTMLKVVSLLLTVLALTWLYRTVPNRRVASRDALTGALVAGIAFEVMKAGFAYFVSRFGAYKLVYGAFAGFPVFLMWLYFSWLVVLTGAVIAAALPQLRTGAWSRMQVPGSRYVEALALLRTLYERYREGGASGIDVLSRSARLTWDDTEMLLTRMAEAGWVARSGPDGWLLARDPGGIELSAVFDAFVFDSGELQREVDTIGLRQHRWDAATAVTGGLTLEAWCANAAANGS